MLWMRLKILLSAVALLVMFVALVAGMRSIGIVVALTLLLISVLLPGRWK